MSTSGINSVTTTTASLLTTTQTPAKTTSTVDKFFAKIYSFFPEKPAIFNTLSNRNFVILTTTLMLATIAAIYFFALGKKQPETSIKTLLERVGADENLKKIMDENTAVESLTPENFKEAANTLKSVLDQSKFFESLPNGEERDSIIENLKAISKNHRLLDDHLNRNDLVTALSLLRSSIKDVKNKIIEPCLKIINNQLQ